MPPQDDKLDALAGAVGDLRVGIANIAGDTRAILARLDSQDTAVRDHEGRLRTIEAQGTSEHGPQIKDLRTEVQALREWRARMVGRAAGIGALTTAAVDGVARLLQHVHV